MIARKIRGSSLHADELNSFQDGYDAVHYASWKTFLSGAFTAHDTDPSAASTISIRMGAPNNFSADQWDSGFPASLPFPLHPSASMHVGAAGAARSIQMRLLVHIANNNLANSSLTTVALYAFSGIDANGLVQFGSAVAFVSVSPLAAGDVRRLETVFAAPANGLYGVRATYGATPVGMHVEGRVRLQHREV